MTAVRANEVRRASDPIVIALGWGLAVTSVADFFMGFALAAQENPGASWYPEMIVANVAQHLLMLAGVYAVMRSGAGGRAGLATGGFAIALSGIAILCIAEPVTLISLSVAYPLFGVAMLAMAAGLTMAGVAVARAGRWRGASRFSLAAAGVFIPLVMVPAMLVPGLWFHYAIGLWGLTFLWVAATLLRAEWR
jgi:hypothetical protein